MFVDVQANLLFYVVAVWEDDFTGYVIDYPDQQRAYFMLRDARITLQMVWKSAIHARRAVPMGDRGCLSLFGDRAVQH